LSRFTEFCGKRLAGRIAALRTDVIGATAVSFALMTPALVGAFGVAGEVGYWRYHQRVMQNAADSAAIAAATAGSANWSAEGQSVAAQYGFLNGAGNVTVSVTRSAVGSSCGANCFTVAITDAVPPMLSSVVGYNGNTTVNGQHVTTIRASSTAAMGTAYSYCLLALASSGTSPAIRANGVNNSDLGGCNTMSDTAATCNGHDLNAAEGDAVGVDNGCGILEQSNQPAVSDQWSGLAANIPANTCNNYPQEPKKGNLASSNRWSGSYDFNGAKIVCGDQQLTADTTINDTILVIENGMLDTNGFTLTGANLTVVFTGSANNGNYNHYPTGGGILNVSSPTSGPWSGVAMYQDPALTTNINVAAAGYQPAWDISGLVYLPHSSVELKGAVNKAAAGQLCFVMIVDNVLVDGTGSIFKNNTQCLAQGLIPPSGGQRGALVN
jgi:Flp pilus assembly protein TadG